ncbi:MAG: ATP-binding cassette domain-containing protein [Vicinamibacterales bacterium]
MSDVALSFASLGFAYKPGEWVFRNYEAEIRTGSILAILGPNGRGKTTLLKLLLGLLKPTEGQITVVGQTAFVPQLFTLSFRTTRCSTWW